MHQRLPRMVKNPPISARFIETPPFAELSVYYYGRETLSTARPGPYAAGGGTAYRENR